MAWILVSGDNDHVALEKGSRRHLSKRAEVRGGLVCRNGGVDLGDCCNVVSAYPVGHGVMCDLMATKNDIRSAERQARHI